MLYNVTNLGAVSIYDLNNHAQLTGSDPSNSAFIYSGGQSSPLPVHATTGWSANLQSTGNLRVPELTQSQGNAINDSGDVAGTAMIADNQQAGLIGFNLEGGFFPGMRAFLIHKGKFVDLHTKLTELGYFWSTGMDVTNRSPEGSLSVVGIGDQGPWLIHLTEHAATQLERASVSLQASSLCHAPWNLPKPTQAYAGTPIHFYLSIRINNSAQMAVCSDTAWYLCDATVTPPVSAPNIGFTGVVEAFNDRREILLSSGVSSNVILQLSPTGGGTNWTQSAYNSRNLGGQWVGNNLYKRLMNNNGDALLSTASLHLSTEAESYVSVFLNNSGSTVDLTQYLNPDGLSYGQGINDQGLICCRTGAGSVLLTPQYPGASQPHVNIGGGLQRPIIEKDGQVNPGTGGSPIYNPPYQGEAPVNDK